jgi:ABC-2 type transport system ATP-binding protein
MQRSTPVIRVGDLGKTFRVPEREPGLRAAARSLVRRRHREVRAVDGLALARWLWAVGLHRYSGASA